MKNDRKQFCRRTRREFLWQAGGGFTALPLASMLAEDGFLARQTHAADGKSTYQNPLAPKPPPLAPKPLPPNPSNRSIPRAPPPAPPAAPAASNTVACLKRDT